MKYFVIILFFGLIGFAGLFPLVNQAYGLWIPESPDTLLEQSQTVFVGNITSVNVIEFEKSSIYSTEENGVEKQIIENYTLSLDQYTVSVEEFLKNPQNSSTMKVLQPTTSIPGRIVPIGGFAVGDRVLFYLEKIDEENTYSPESFEIPKQCDAKSTLYKPRIALGNGFRIMQNGIQRDDNFTAGIQMQFVYDIDTRTLEGKDYDFVVGIVKRLADNSIEHVLKEKIHTRSNPCEWISSAKWEITPTQGKHIMAIQISEEDGDGGSYSIQFFVKENISTENKPPLKHPKSGAEREILILLENKVRKVYYSGENIISVLADPETASVIFETGANAKLNVKAPKVYKVGPGLFTLRNGEEFDAVTNTDECFYYATIETEDPEKIEIIFAAWPEYKELVENCETFTVSPLKQIKLGIEPSNVVCGDGLSLLLKPPKFTSPACVTDSTYQELSSRGWSLVGIWNDENEDKELELRGIETGPATDPKELFQEKYDAVVEGTIIGCMGHKETYPIRYQCEIQVDSYIKYDGEKTGQLTALADRDRLDEDNQRAIFGLDYHDDENYYEIIESGFSRK